MDERRNVRSVCADVVGARETVVGAHILVVGPHFYDVEVHLHVVNPFADEVGAAGAVGEPRSDMANLRAPIDLSKYIPGSGCVLASCGEWLLRTEDSNTDFIVRSNDCA
jgi:hypothetical protein